MMEGVITYAIFLSECFLNILVAEHMINDTSNISGTC